jgi:hypothetical protein
MIEYYASTLSPDCFFASLDNVIVAQWYKYKWIDRAVYRPVRKHYVKIEWTGLAYDPALLINPTEFEIVKATGREAPIQP